MWKVVVLKVNEDQIMVTHTEHNISNESTAIIFAKHWTKQPDEDTLINPKQVAFVMLDEEPDGFGHIFPKTCTFVRTVMNGHDTME